MASKRAKSKHHVRSYTDPLVKQSYDPSQREISQACERIQSTWSPEEKDRRRCAETLVEWELPVVERFDCDRDLDE